MKRRNAECGKIRRPVKRTKIAEGLYGSTFLYVKFLLVWALVLLADFILEFRFEYLWPFWLLLRSVYDSFKYQGLAFSVFFVFIAFTSDMICFLFIPVHWLFFAASTYVWVQYVWHTERGICLPTISLWLLFVYIEASVRLKELKNLPFHLDLCRPFAAHCIGYPVVTLGFGFKSYVGYRMRLRKQKEVAKENEFYMQLLHQALPAETPSIAGTCSPEKEKASKVTEEIISNGVAHCGSSQSHGRKSICAGHPNSGNNSSNSHNSTSSLPSLPSATNSVTYTELDVRDVKKHNCNNSPIIDKHDYQYMETQLAKQTNSVNDFDESDESCEREKSFKSGVMLCSPAATRGTSNRWNHNNSVKDNLSTQHVGSSKKNRNNSSKEMTANNLNSQKDEHTYRLEVKIWLLISCQSAVEAYCFLYEKNQSHMDENDAMHSDWVRLWELCIKSVALMPQCHEAGHDLLATMIKYKLIFPRTEFYKLYAPGSNNKLSLASLRTLAVYMVKFCLPSSLALSPSKGFGLSQQTKDWFRFQVLNWLFISETSQEMSNLVNQLLCDNFDVDGPQFLSVLIVSLCLQDCKSFISNFPALQCKKPDSGKFPWIQELETELLHLTFDLPFDTKSEHEENSQTQENFMGKLLHSVWDKCIKALLSTSNELFDHFSQEQTLNPYAHLKQADLILQVLKNMYLHHIINEDDLHKSPLTKSLKNLINEATEILSGKEIRGVKGVSAEHKIKWMKNTIPVISDMLLPCGLKLSKCDKEKKILAWIADLFPPKFVNILLDIINWETVAPVSSPSKPGSSRSISRLPSSQSVTSGDDSLDEMFDEVPTDFQRPPAKRRNRYSPLETTVDDFIPSIEMDESNDSADVKKEYLTNPDVLPEKEKVQVMCAELIGKFCCLLSAGREQSSEFLPSKIVKKILDVARNKRNTGLKKPEDVQMLDTSWVWVTGM